MASSSLSRAAMPLQISDNSADIPPRSSLFPIHRLRHARSPACALACGAFLRAFPPVRGGRKVGCSLLAAACPHPTFGTTAVGTSFPSPGVSQRRAAWLPPVSNPGKPGWLCFIFAFRASPGIFFLFCSSGCAIPLKNVRTSNRLRLLSTSSPQRSSFTPRIYPRSVLLLFNTPNVLFSAFIRKLSRSEPKCPSPALEKRVLHIYIALL